MRPTVSTFSIVAIDRDTGEIGVAVASKFLAVGAVVPWARAGVGAAVTQAMADMSQGPTGLDLLAQGLTASDAVERIIGGDEERDGRQIAFVDAQGRSAAWTGEMCLPWAGHRTGEGYTCQGNILSGARVVEAMSESFEGSRGQLPERMLAALDAGHQAGGDSRGQQSAALYVAKKGGSFGGHMDRYIDLRVDDHEQPLAELQRLLSLHREIFGSGGRPTLMRPSGNVAREIQRILKSRGHYRGEQTSTYDDATQEALMRFCQVENLEERLAAARERGPEWIDREILDYMRRRYGRER